MNAAASQLETTWPSLRKAFGRHGLGMPTPNPEAVRQRAIAAARQRTGQPATPPLDPVFVALNPQAVPARPRPPAELYQWVRRDEEYATLGANVVVERVDQTWTSPRGQPTFVRSTMTPMARRYECVDAELLVVDALETPRCLGHLWDHWIRALLSVPHTGI